MNVVSVEFLRSAASAADLPRDPWPQLAMVGRSNVGKSSLINALSKRRVARTSAAPGKTRLVNLYLVETAARDLHRCFLVDLPGYGYARGGETSRAEFDRLVRVYYAHPPHGDPLAADVFGPTASLVLVDARHPGLAADVAAVSWIAAIGRPFLVVAAKVDKLSRAERTTALEAWSDALHCPVTPISSVTGEGLDALWTTISRTLSRP